VVVPATLTVGPGQTISLPISIAPTPAPSGGLTIAVATSDASHIEVLTPSVTIPQGAVSVNATIRGAGIGVATLTASRADYASGRSQVTTTGNLNVVQTSATFNAGFTSSITVQLETSGAQVAAPSPGIAVTVTAANPACVAATSPVTIATGLTSITSTLSYGGTATLPCTTVVTARATDITSDTMTVTVNPAAAMSLIGFPSTVGAGLQTGLNFTARLGTSQHGGRTVHVQSSDPTVALVAPDTTTVGTASFDVTVPNGTIDVNFVVQGVEGAPVPTSATITATATGFSSATATINVVRPALQLSGLDTTSTSLSADDPFQVQIGLPASGNGFLSPAQAVRRGGTALTATITHTNAPAAQLITTGATGQTVTVTIPAGQSISASTVAAGGVAFHPVTTGQTTVSATIPGFTATTAASAAVTVSVPTIAMIGLPSTVGAGLQTGLSFTARLGATQHGGVTMHIASSNAAIALVAPDTTTPGTAAIDVTVPNGSTDVNFVLQGAEGAPVPTSATITASATGFTNGSGTLNVVRPALQLANLDTTSTSLSPDDPFQVQVGLPVNGNAFLSPAQVVRRGGTPLTATITHTNAGAAQLITTAATGQTVTVTIPVGQSISASTVATGGVAFHPVATGTTTVSASIPGFTATTAASSPVTVSVPVITMIGFPSTVGAGLQTGLSFTARLGASLHGGVTMHIASSNAAIALVAPNTTTTGTASIDVPVANGATDVSFVVQGVEGAPVPTSATITASATGFTSGTGTINVVRPAVGISGLDATSTSLSADDPFQVQVGLPSNGNGFISPAQVVRRGGTALTATITHTNPAAAQLVTNGATGQTVTVTIPVGASISPSTVAAGGVAFHPFSTGTTTVSASIPGFVPTNDASVAVAVSTPAIQMIGFPGTVGAGLQTNLNFTARLGATQHGGVTLHIASSSSTAALVAPNTTTGGTASIDVTVPNGSTDVSFVVQGLENAPVPATVTITASAAGFTSGTGAVTVVQPALQITGLNTTPASTASDDPFQVQVGLPSTNDSFLSPAQSVRIGGTALTVTVTHTNTAVAQLRTTGATGQTVTGTINPGQSSSPSTVAGGGVAFDSGSAGQTTVSASIPGFIVTSAGVVVVTISP
jgi:hypothetical protein